MAYYAGLHLILIVSGLRVAGEVLWDSLVSHLHLMPIKLTLLEGKTPTRGSGTTAWKKRRWERAGILSGWWRCGWKIKTELGRAGVGWTTVWQTSEVCQLRG